MLKHPTYDQLYALGLHGMAKALVEIAAAAGEADGLGHHEWLGLLLDREAGAKTNASREGCASPNYASRPASRMSTIAVPAGSTASCSRSSSRANGLTPTTIWP